MTYTAKYTNAEHTSIVRSDMPGASIPAAGGNRHFQEVLDDNVIIAAFAPPAITVLEVKTEAARRILEVAPEWKQRNLTARAAEFALIIGDGGALTAEQEAERAAGQAIWDAIKIVRAKSDEIEALDPIPADFKNDSYWT